MNRSQGIGYFLIFVVSFFVKASIDRGFDVRFALTKPVSMQLSGSSMVYASADRAIVHLRISAEGTKQTKVSDEIRSTLSEIMSILRPLTQNHTTSSAPAAIKDISVDELESSSWQKDTIIGQSTVYTGRAKVQSEFSDMESLGVVLSKLSKIPRLKVNEIRWRLSDELKAKVSAESREKAMRDLLAKGNAYIKPLGLKPLRATSISEDSHRIRSIGEPAYFDWGNHNPRRSYASKSGWQHMDALVLHDELDHNSRWSAEEIAESYEMESRSLEIFSQVSASCEAW